MNRNSDKVVAPSGAVAQGSFDVVAPKADVLMESLRATGYSLPDAICDLIDNSITAGARNVWLDFHWAGVDSWVSILDDGCGMAESSLIDAMRIGSKSPQEQRDPSDLGRYGLGLKTASISQARSLTVATHTGNNSGIHIRQWDLDHLGSVGDWQLLKVPIETIAEHHSDRLYGLNHGTLVIWNKLDRLVGEARADNVPTRRQFHNALRGVEERVAMVFHRFMAERNPLSIWLNEQMVKPWGPFPLERSCNTTTANRGVGEPWRLLDSHTLRSPTPFPALQ